jgi:hypothetical protein
VVSAYGTATRILTTAHSSTHKLSLCRVVSCRWSCRVVSCADLSGQALWGSRSAMDLIPRPSWASCPVAPSWCSRS